MTAGATPQKAQGARTRRTLSAGARLRQRRLMQIGCVPAAITGALALLVIINLISLQDVSYTYFTNPDPVDLLLRRALTVSFFALGVIQLAGGWIMGIVGAVAGASAAVGRGHLLRRRLAVYWRRTVIMAVAVVTLRLMMFATGVLGAALIVGRVITFNPTSEQVIALNNMLRSYVLGLAAFAVAAVLSALVGPFLRLRYSIALGALAGTWASEPVWRTWLGLRARLAAGLLGATALPWAVACGVLAQAVAEEISMRSSTNNLLGGTSGVVLGTLALTVVLTAFLAGQVMLPEGFLWLARRRLRRVPEKQERRLAPP